MKSSLADEAEYKTPSSHSLLPKDRTILEREFMEFRPFGLDEQGETIRDLTGMSIREVVVYLEKSCQPEPGTDAGGQAVSELCRLLNDRIKDPVYHVTPEFLKNPWNSYSFEFTAYLYEFCERISGDSRFVFRAGTEKASPILQVLARPFSLAQIYGMFPYFGNKFASGSIECRVVEVNSSSATLAMRFSDRTLRQFGPYRRRCAHLVCQSAQGIMAAVPARVHGLPPASLHRISCIADDDDWCEWLIQWQGEGHRRLGDRVWRAVAGREQLSSPPTPLNTPLTGPPANTGHECDHGTAIASAQRMESLPHLHRRMRRFLWGPLLGVTLGTGVLLLNSGVAFAEVILAVLCPILLEAVVINRRLRRESRQREALIHEQVSFAESRHEDLREAYLEQEQTRVELRRKVSQLTALHRAGLLFGSTFERDTLLQQVLETLTRDLRYDRAMVSVFDPARSLIEHVRVIGVAPEVQAFAQSCRIPVTDRESPEGTVVLLGRPLLIDDIRSVWRDLHPLNQQLVEMSRTKALIVVPLKTKDRILGTLTVDRTDQQSLTQDDLELMTTVASQVAIALDNASAYQQIEEWNAGLELKVRERTAALEQADRLRSQFLSHVSHELKTPLTSIKGFLQNLLDGLTGPLNDKQHQYLTRMLHNSDRLIRMIDDLLDRTRIETGRLELQPADVDLELCVTDAMEQLRPLAHAKRQTLDVCCPEARVLVWADRDRLIQVMVNLIQNAVKFTPEDGRITVTIEPPTRRMATILVRDTGPGIPPECVEKIFDPFFRVQEEKRSGPKGLGLGLAIVKNLVELQGGAVTARNHPDGGAELCFTVPIRSVGSSPGSGARGTSRKILVVDDDEDIRESLLDRLRTNGYQPAAVLDGRQALEAMESEDLGGVILDIGICHMDGLEVLRQIRLRSQCIPVIMITASGSQELAVKAIGMGAQAYLLKPFDAAELQQLMDCWFQPA
ncbi:MAG TPA: ATP-binding protein [Nitrospiraceae bacterium]|nr:ATP-binding protein [Nitrospiraceae bacterium]